MSFGGDKLSYVMLFGERVSVKDKSLLNNNDAVVYFIHCRIHDLKKKVVRPCLHGITR